MSELTLLSESDRSLMIIIQNLESLQRLAGLFNFRKVEDRQSFIQAALNIRKQYQICESIIVGSDVVDYVIPEIEPIPPRFINPKQIQDWIDKLVNNISRYLSQPNNDYKKQYDFIKQQYPLIDIVIKVLNGRAYFVGIGQS